MILHQRNTWRSHLLDRKNPNRTSFRNFRKLARENSIEGILIAARIPTPTRFDGDVLFSVNQERGGRRLNAGVRWELPEQLARHRIEGMKLPVIGAPAEHQSPGCRQHRAPV